MRDGYNKMEDGYNKLKEVHSSALEDNERLRKELQDVRSGMQQQSEEDPTDRIETPQAQDTHDDQVRQKANI
jgi:regulator of replication initiation timing